MARKILLVDDDLNILKLLNFKLKAQSYDVIVASDGLQAIAKARRENPDLIILDIMMPAGGGINVYEKLKIMPETSIIPVIFITADQSDEVRKKVVKMGADAFFTKPFEAEVLLAEIKNIIGS